jgi:hypothetical protein
MGRSMNENKKLTEIRNRYFRSVIKRKDGLITHHGDCDIHNAKEIYGFATCTCGLLHDLQWINYRLAEKIYPNFGTELAKSEMTWEEEKNWKPISEEDSEKFFKDNGFVINNFIDEEALKKEDEAQWEIIKEVFGKEYVQYLQEL